MSSKEINRLELIVKLSEKQISRLKVCELLNLSYRQVGNLLSAYKKGGASSLIHGNRGRVSNRKYADSLRTKVIKIVGEKYYDFGPTFASEKLSEEEGITISRETLRKWMIDSDLWTLRKRRKKQKPREFRKRKDSFGQMVQLDGSKEYWFESRGPVSVLMGYIDDATNNVFARFYESESTYSAMDSLKKYIQMYGKPTSLYLDRHSAYKTTREPNLDEQLKGDRPLTQFGRVVKLLEIELKYAYSAQAKGRIENLFKRLQDRLIKELRLAEIDNIDDANKFLESFLVKFNKKFAIPASSSLDYHRKVPEDLDLDWIFTLEENRVIAKDHTVRWKNRIFLIKNQDQYLKNIKVKIVENLKGEVRVMLGEYPLDYEEVTVNSLYYIRNNQCK